MGEKKKMAERKIDRKFQNCIIRDTKKFEIVH